MSRKPMVSILRITRRGAVAPRVRNLKRATGAFHFVAQNHSSPFHGAGHETAHEVAAGDDIDEKRGGGGHDGTSEMNVVFAHAGGRIDEVVQRHGHRSGT